MFLLDRDGEMGQARTTSLDGAHGNWCILSWQLSLGPASSWGLPVSQAASPPCPEILTSQSPEQMRCLHPYTGRSPSALLHRESRAECPRHLLAAQQCSLSAFTHQARSKWPVPALGMQGPSLQRVACKVRCE